MDVHRGVGTCTATAIFGADDKDGMCTFHCELPEGHAGLHLESGDLYGTKYRLYWNQDMSKPESWDSEARKVEE